MIDGAFFERSILAEGTFQLLDQIKGRGYASDFQFENGRVRCLQSGADYCPRDLEIEAIYRFEGRSEPGDFSALYVLVAKDGTRGTLIEGFAQRLAPEVAELICAIPDHRAESIILKEAPRARALEVAARYI